MTRKLILASVAMVTLSLSGCGNGGGEAQMEAMPYELMSIATSDFASSSIYSASVQGQQDIEIYPQVSGYLESIAVNEGQVVKQGDLLFTIEQAPYRAAYNAAEASVEMAQATVATAELNYNNSEQLHSKGIISDSELTMSRNELLSAKAALSSAKAGLLSAKANLDFTMIKAPSAGVVGKLPYRRGALVSSALPQSLTIISDNSNMYVYFSMNEKQIYDLLDSYGSLDAAIEGMTDLELRLTNGSTYDYKGEVESISGVIDSSTGAVSLRAKFENPERRLLSGSTASVVIANNLENSIVIPKAATVELQGKHFVYRVVDGVATSTPIEISRAMNATEYVVTSGLKVGDVIIASGAGLVHEGTPVKQ